MQHRFQYGLLMVHCEFPLHFELAGSHLCCVRGEGTVVNKSMTHTRTSAVIAIKKKHGLTMSG